MLGFLFLKVFGAVLGSLYPGYMSYKAIKSRDNKEYVRGWVSPCFGSATAIFLFSDRYHAHVC